MAPRANPLTVICGAKCDGQRAGQCSQPGLADGVGKVVRTWPQRPPVQQVDDPSTATRFVGVCECLAQQKGRRKVDGHMPLPVLQGGVAHPKLLKDGSVVHQCVKRAERRACSMRPAPGLISLRSAWSR
jgi:hypothetical protein